MEAGSKCLRFKFMLDRAMLGATRAHPRKLSLMQHVSPEGSREESSGPVLDSGHFCLTTHATPSEIYVSAGRSMSSLYHHRVVVLSAANLGAQSASDYYPPMYVGDRTFRGLVSSSMPVVPASGLEFTLWICGP